MGPNGVPQRSLLEPVWLNIFINDTDNGIKCTLNKLAKQDQGEWCFWHAWGTDCHPEGPEKAWEAGLCESYKVQGWVQDPAPESRQALVSTQTGEWREQSCWERLGGLVGEELDVIQQCVLAAEKANHVLCCIQSNMASRGREGILPLHLSEIPPGTLHSALGPPT